MIEKEVYRKEMYRELTNEYNKMFKWVDDFTFVGATKHEIEAFSLFGELMQTVSCVLNEMEQTLLFEKCGNCDEKSCEKCGYKQAKDKVQESDMKDNLGIWKFVSFEEIINSGEWIIDADWKGNGYYCSECGTLVAELPERPNIRYHWCPFCGKKMKQSQIRRG